MKQWGLFCQNQDNDSTESYDRMNDTSPSCRRCSEA